MKLSDILHINKTISSKENKELYKALINLLGFKPKHLQHYIIALTHSSIDADVKKNNERLEYLGDAILGSIVAEYLFKKYPTQTEGIMSSMRSKIISRISLNKIALKLGLNKIIRFNSKQINLHHSDIFGNALEALVGAIYLDTNYERTKDFIINQMINNCIDLSEVEAHHKDSKSILMSWSQKNSIELEFRILKEFIDGRRRVFDIGVYVNDELKAHATGYSKKEAQKNAADKFIAENSELFTD